jgi:Ni,Fe-hydrogenase III large subunit/Ni,Fe-hydrogenase III component G
MKDMPSLADITAQGHRVAAHRPWPRVVVLTETWIAVARELAAGRATLLGLWATGGATSAVHMALKDQDANDFAVVSLECPGRTFPSVGVLHPPAIRLERAVHSLYGLEPLGAIDARPWLDLSFWDVQFPLGVKRPTPETPEPYQFLPVQGESLHRIPVGPVHAGIIEPGHFRFTCSGETVARLEQRLGYAHKGIEGLMAGATIDAAAKLAARTSGDSTVAYGIAFAHAVEAALNIKVPPRAVYLRALMAELERLANHFGDIGAICNDASFALMHAHCGVLREQVLRAADACFGHRLMMDRVIPGRVLSDISSAGIAILRDALKTFRQRLPRLVELYDNTASLQDRTVSTGIVKPDYAEKFGAAGYVGRASGRNFDARKAVAYAPYDNLDFAVPVLLEGDVNARVWIRIHEVEQSFSLIDQIIEHLPNGPITTSFELRGSGEGLGLVEGFRGDVLAAVRIEDDKVDHCYLRDPSWFQWPLLETAIEGNIVADFPLCNKSFNCSYSGHDL